MAKTIKSKVFWSIWPTDEIYKYNTITWEYERLEVIRNEQSIRIKPNKIFMKTFLWWNQIQIYHKVWEDCKYLWVLWDCMWYENDLNIKKFKESINISDSNFSRLKKRLIDNGDIANNEWQYFLNPCIAVKRDTIDSSLWTLFKEKNATLYSITEL